MLNSCTRRKRTLEAVFALLIFLAGIVLPAETAAAASVYTNAEPVSVRFSMSDKTEYKLAQMEKAFPDGKFWNYHDENKLGSAKQWAVTVNGKTYYVSTKACSESNRTIHDDYDIIGTNRLYCQSNVNYEHRNSRSCMGFASMFYEMLWGRKVESETRVEYKDDPNLLELVLPGDLVVMKGHWFIATDRNEDGTLEYVDCNGQGICKISWTHTSARFNEWKNKMINASSGRVYLHNPEESYRQRERLRREAMEKAPKATDSETGHVYYLVSSNTSWTAAREYAQSLGEGYDLATMDGSSAGEQSIIEKLVKDYGYACWLGGSDTSGTWQWVNGTEISTSDTRWDEGEPSCLTSSGSAEHYLGIYANDTQTSYATTNKWNDFKLSTSTVKGFVVEYTSPTPGVSWTPLYYQRAVYALQTEQGYLKAEPYADAENLFTFTDSSRIVEISGAYKNKYGNVWLKVERIWLNSSSNDAIDMDGYVYAEYAHYGFDMASASCTGTVLPSSIIQKGEKVDINASITSTDSITDVSILLYQLPDLTLLQRWDSTEDPVLGDLTTTVDLDNLEVTKSLDLGNLGTGKYRLCIIVPVRVPENNAGEFVEAYEADFEVKETGIQKISFVRPTGSYANRLSVLKETFPEGWYWNHWTQSQLGSGIQHDITVDGHTTSVSSVPCDSSHSDNQYWGAWHGTRACGFARMLFDLTWNMDTEADCYCYKYSMSSDEDGYFLNYLAPGDMIYTGSNGTNRYYYVTAVDGDTVTYAACNTDGKCVITWNNKTTKQVLLTEMEAGAEASTKVSGYICSPVPIAFSASEFTWEAYSVTAGSATFKRTASTSSQIADSFVLNKGDIFYVGTNHLCEDKNGSVWGYCRTSDNQYGWLRMDNGSCTPVEVTDPSISMLSWDAGTSIYFLDPEEESFAVGSSAVITLLDTGVSGFTWETTDDSIFLLEPDPEDEYRCKVTALQAGTARLMVAGITSPEFTVPECYTMEYEGAVFTFEADVQTDDHTELTLKRINQPASRTQIPSTVNGCPVTSITHGTDGEDSTILALEIGSGVQYIHDDAFPYTLKKIQSVSVPESVQIIGTGAFAFDYPVFVDFYFDGMYTMFENEAIHMDAAKLGDETIYGEDYRITFHCRAGSSAENYALDHGWNIVYTDEVTLSFDRPSIALFSGVPFSGPAEWTYKVVPESLQYKIEPEFTSSDDCVQVDVTGLWPVEPGSATVTVTYGPATASVNVNVLGRSDCLILPGSTQIVDQQAFYGNHSIKAVVLPDGIERIESNAFANCTNMLAIWCPSSLSFIAPDAFVGCPNICLYMSLDDPGIAKQYAQYHELNYELCENP